MIGANLLTQAGRQLVAKGGTGVQAADSLTSLVNTWKEYQNTRQVEITKRDQIAADRDVRLLAIKKQADIFHDLIHRTFSERANMFDRCFDLLEEGFSSNDDRKINSALTMIVEQVKINPMAQAIQIMQQINDPNVKRIDI